MLKNIELKKMLKAMVCVLIFFCTLSSCGGSTWELVFLLGRSLWRVWDHGDWDEGGLRDRCSGIPSGAYFCSIIPVTFAHREFHFIHNWLMALFRDIDRIISVYLI